MSANRRLAEVLRSVIAEKDGEWDDDGDRWLVRPDPDTAFLSVDALADAIEARLARDFWPIEPKP